MMAVLPMMMVKTRSSRDQLPWALSVPVVFVSISVAVAGVVNEDVAVDVVVLMIRALAIAHLPPTPLLLLSSLLLEPMCRLHPLLRLTPVLLLLLLHYNSLDDALHWDAPWGPYLVLGPSPSELSLSSDEGK